MFSIPGLMSVVFFSSIAIVLLKLVFRNNNAILHMDIRFLMICMLLIVMRMFIPIESPVANNIPVYKIYPDVYIFIKESSFSIIGKEVHLLELFVLIWLIGAVIALIMMICSYVALKRRIDRFEKLEDPGITDIVSQIGAEFGRRIPFRLLSEKSVGTPFVFGILKPCIVIPEIELTDREAYLVLKHEMLHYYRGDTILKVFCEMLKAVYWWNPFVYMLVGLIANMQEINVDFKITKSLPDLEQLDYSECLIKVARNRIYKIRENRWLVSFQKESPSKVHKRINLMMKNMEINGKKTIASVILSGVILGLVVLCPNVMNLEPYSVAEKDVGDSFGGREGGIWCLDNKDGTYSLYIGGQYCKTVLESELSDENIKIYDSLEDVE